jgi:uncharacterized protein YaaQ
MKMILAVMPTNLSETVSRKLLGEDYRVTKFASTSGFLTGGVTTLMAGVANDRVDACLNIIRDQIPETDMADSAHSTVTIYVLNLKDFSRV